MYIPLQMEVKVEAEGSLRHNAALDVLQLVEWATAAHGAGNS